jgi:hypothetical protein
MATTNKDDGVYAILGILTQCDVLTFDDLVAGGWSLESIASYADKWWKDA